MRHLVLVQSLVRVAHTSLNDKNVANQRQSRAGHTEQGSVIQNNVPQLVTMAGYKNFRVARHYYYKYLLFQKECFNSSQ